MGAIRRIGIRDLRDNATRVLSSVREERLRYVVTVRGRPVAALVALEDAAATATDDELDLYVDQALTDAEFDAELQALRREVTAAWSSDQDAASVVASQRR
jgi:prevent-host-death family protein